MLSAALWTAKRRPKGAIDAADASRTISERGRRLSGSCSSWSVLTHRTSRDTASCPDGNSQLRDDRTQKLQWPGRS